MAIRRAPRGQKALLQCLITATLSGFSVNGYFLAREFWREYTIIYLCSSIDINDMLWQNFTCFCIHIIFPQKLRSLQTMGIKSLFHSKFTMFTCAKWISLMFDAEGIFCHHHSLAVRRTFLINYRKSWLKYTRAFKRVPISWNFWHHSL